MQVIHCSRCRAFIQADEPRYLIGVHVTLDTEGSGEWGILDVPGEPDPDESLTDIFTREMAFTLCKPCRDRFVQNPIDRLEGPTIPPDRGFVQ